MILMRQRSNMSIIHFGKLTWLNSLILGAACFSFFFSTVPSVQGASYDYYVKEGENGDGSSGDPFGSIKDAVEAVGDKKGKKIFVEKGSYSSSFTLPRETELIGADAKTTILTGVITLENKTQVSKIGLTGAGGILITKNANVTIEKVRIKNLTGTGIKSDSGGATVKVRDSLIEKANKGMYLQAGTTAEIEGIEVIGNGQEGIDIRENVDGFVKNSIFRDNKESGIEIILGSSDFAITNSTFSDNGASGIAAQFFHGAKKIGNVRIENNTFSKNDWGVDCKAPQGNMDSKFYFLNSLTIQNNTFKEHKDGEIARRCKIMTDEERKAFEEEEAKKKAAIEERIASLSLSEGTLAERMAQATLVRKTSLERFTALEQSRIEPVLASLDILSTDGMSALDTMREERQSWTCYLSGVERSQARLERSHEILINLLQKLEREKTVLRFEANQALVTERLQALVELQSAIEAVQTSPTCPFSLLGWLFRLMGDDATAKSILAEDTDKLTLLDQREDRKLLWLSTLSYFPKVREVAVRSGDNRLFESIAKLREGYQGLVADIRLPFGTEADPLPPASLTTELSFPLRFTNLLATLAPEVLHLGFGVTALTDAKALERTQVNLEYADIRPFGRSANAEKELSLTLGTKEVHWLTLFESDTDQVKIVNERLKQLKSEGKPTVLVLTWDEKKGKTITSERRASMKNLVQSGADLILGTGLILPFETETIEGVPVYYATGSAFERFQSGKTDGKAVALEIGLNSDGGLEVTERPLTFTAERGLELLP